MRAKMHRLTKENAYRFSKAVSQQLNFLFEKERELELELELVYCQNTT
jgi:hypothetical protein